MKIFMCIESGCNEPPYLGGYCKKHHAVKILKEEKIQTARKAIFYQKIDDKKLTHSELEADLQRLNSWWDKASFALRTNTRDEILGDEAEASLSWCITLAEEIVEAERRFRNGEFIGSSFEITRNWVWDRFNNLEKGLHSNGTKR